MADRRDQPDRGLHHLHRQEGSALLLVPALALVVVLLGAMAVDRAVVVAGQADLVQVAQDAAAAGAAVGIDLDDLRADGVLRHDPGAIDRAVHRSVRATEPDAAVAWRLHGEVVEVRLRRSVPLVLSPRWLAGSHQTVAATATARLEVREP